MHRRDAGCLQFASAGRPGAVARDALRPPRLRLPALRSLWQVAQAIHLSIDLSALRSDWGARAGGMEFMGRATLDVMKPRRPIRIAIRCSPGQKTRLKQAADVAHRALGDFVVESACTEAAAIIAAADGLKDLVGKAPEGDEKATEDLRALMNKIPPWQDA